VLISPPMIRQSVVERPLIKLSQNLVQTKPLLEEYMLRKPILFFYKLHIAHALCRSPQLLILVMCVVLWHLAILLYHFSSKRFESLKPPCSIILFPCRAQELPTCHKPLVSSYICIEKPLKA
jgi:hypothetical protein